MRSVERRVGRSRGPARRDVDSGRTVGRTLDARSTMKMAGAAVRFGFTWTFDCAGAPWRDVSDRSAQHALRTGVLQQSCVVAAGVQPGRTCPAYAGIVDTPMSATMSASAENAVLREFTTSIVQHPPCQWRERRGRRERRRALPPTRSNGENGGSFLRRGPSDGSPPSAARKGPPYSRPGLYARHRPGALCPGIVRSAAGNPAAALTIVRNAPQFAWHPAWNPSTRYARSGQVERTLMRTQNDNVFSPMNAITGVAGILFGVIVGYVIGSGQLQGPSATASAAPAATTAPQSTTVVTDADLQPYRNILAQDPKNAGAAAALANKLYDAGRYSDAIPYYQQALTNDPKNVNV